MPFVNPSSGIVKGELYVAANITHLPTNLSLQVSSSYREPTPGTLHFNNLFMYRYHLAKLQIRNQILPQYAELSGATGCNGNLPLLHDHQDPTPAHGVFKLRPFFLASAPLWVCCSSWPLHWHVMMNRSSSSPLSLVTHHGRHQVPEKPQHPLRSTPRSPTLA